MTSTIVKYGLMHIAKNKILGYEAEVLDAEFTVGIAHSLSTDEDNEWLVDNAEHAEYVRQNSTEYYNADYDTPVNEYKPEELKVVMVLKVVTVEDVTVNIPSFKEMMEYKYGNAGKEPNVSHLQHVLQMKKKHPDLNYTLYDLIEWQRNQGIEQ